MRIARIAQGSHMPGFVRYRHKYARFSQIRSYLLIVCVCVYVFWNYNVWFYPTSICDRIWENPLYGIFSET